MRIETSPEDLKGMLDAAGILTARGGMTSHAAVVARGMGKCCVSGAGELEIDYKTRTIKVNGFTVKEGDWGVGPKIGVYTNAGADGAIFGIGAAGQYSITDNWRVAPSILALCKTGCSVDISADVQYLFNIAPDWHIYPLAGISANDIGDWSCGINLGGGADFSITRNWDVSAGFKWMIQTAKDYVPGFVKRRNPIVINIGATYRF